MIGETTIDVYEDKAEEWRWRLVHANGNTMADSSEGYSSKQAVLTALNKVREYMTDSGTYLAPKGLEEGLVDKIVEMYNDAERVIKYTEDSASTEAAVDLLYEVRDGLQLILEQHANIKFDEDKPEFPINEEN